MMWTHSYQVDLADERDDERHDEDESEEEDSEDVDVDASLGFLVLLKARQLRVPKNNDARVRMFMMRQFKPHANVGRAPKVSAPPLSPTTPIPGFGEHFNVVADVVQCSHRLLSILTSQRNSGMRALKNTKISVGPNEIATLSCSTVMP